MTVDEIQISDAQLVQWVDTLFGDIAVAEEHVSHPEARYGLTTTASVDFHLPPKWKERVVIGVMGTPTLQTNRFLTAQQRAEGGDAKWNPCNTTLWVQNFTELPDYNSVPVRNYSYPNAGVCAHVLTLTQHNKDGSVKYGKMVGEFQANASNGRTAEEMVNNCRSNIDLWGTSAELMLEILREI